MKMTLSAPSFLGKTACRWSLAVLLLAIWLPAAWAQEPEPPAQYDREPVELRDFDEGTLESYRNDPDFNYDPTEIETYSFWDNFRRWVGRLLDFFFGTNERSDRTLYVLIGISAIVIVFAILKLLGIDVRGAFYKVSKPVTLQADLLEEDIHAMDFADLIAKAEAQGQLRRAIRLQYLLALRELSERDLITWQEAKTNQEYVLELRRAELRPAFRQLTRLFEYVWYGDFPLSNAQYYRYAEQFQQFTAGLGKALRKTAA